MQYLFPLTLLALMLLLPDSLYAQSTGVLENPIEAESIQALLAAVLQGVVRLGAVVLLLALIWTGFLFVSAQGSDEKLKSARTVLVWTVVGGVILLGAQLIASIVGDTAQSLTP